MLIAAGDFNGTSDEAFYEVFTTYPYADARYATENTTDEITYPDGEKNIDYIFVNSDKVYVSEFKVLSETNDGRLSDHNGTFAVLQPRHELDLNGDGAVTVVDALELIKAVLDDDSIENGDLNGDGVVGLIDVIRIMKFVVSSDDSDNDEA